MEAEKKPVNELKDGVLELLRYDPQGTKREIGVELLTALDELERLRQSHIAPFPPAAIACERCGDIAFYMLPHKLMCVTCRMERLLPNP